VPNAIDCELASSFLRFSEQECKVTSPLYFSLSLIVASDRQLLDVARACREGQPAPNLFFAAVQFLLLGGVDHPLREYYPNLAGGGPKPTDQLGDVFRDFVLRNRSAIEQVLRRRLVQTNEVNRCTYLLPAFCRLSALAGRRPIALIEIGTSAGLNLCFDRYDCQYGDGLSHGLSSSAVKLQTVLRGPNRPPLNLPLPAIHSRTGVDLNIIDLNDPQALPWMKSLVWPEHRERYRRLEAAAVVVSQVRPRMLEGDGIELLPQLIRTIPADVLPCIFHTHVANQLSQAKRDMLVAVIEHTARDRDLFHLHNNIRPHLHLSGFLDRRRLEIPLARAEGHAQWVEWLDIG
jgi:hypothetical protein